MSLELTPDCILKLMGSASLQIGQVARRTGLSVDAIRFYEKSGLLPQPRRTNGGYRLYNQQEITDLEFIQKAQGLGFSLNEIRELFSIQHHPPEVCRHVRDLIARKLTVVRSKRSELRTMERALAGALRQCNKALRERPQHDDSCPVLKQITRRQTKGRKA